MQSCASEGDGLYGGNFPIAAYLVWSCLSEGRFLNSRQRYLQRAGCQELGELCTNVKRILGINRGAVGVCWGVGDGKGQREEKAYKNNSGTRGLIVLLIYIFQRS